MNEQREKKERKIDLNAQTVRYRDRDTEKDRDMVSKKFTE